MFFETKIDVCGYCVLLYKFEQNHTKIKIFENGNKKNTKKKKLKLRNCLMFEGMVLQFDCRNNQTHQNI